MFENRQEAGQQLAEKLNQYKDQKNTLVLGLPRGGVVTAAEISRALNLPLDIIVIRKMGAPGNPELAIGAVDENGEGPLNDDVISLLNVSKDHIEAERLRAKKEAQQKLKVLKGSASLQDLNGKNVILVDDGLATGATMRTAIHSVKAKGASKIIVAIPVGAPESIQKIETEADEVIFVDAPPYFGSVGSFYRVFDQTSDEEVIALLKRD